MYSRTYRVIHKRTGVTPFKGTVTSEVDTGMAWAVIEEIEFNDLTYDMPAKERRELIFEWTSPPSTSTPSIP